MATYKNKSTAAHVHGGKVYAPGQTFDAKATPNLDKLVKADVLEITTGASGSASASAAAGDDGKAALVARAKELGVPNAGANWGVEKLQQAIAEAEKAAAGGDGKGA